MARSTEEAIHGGFLHEARSDLAWRLHHPQPSLYDCLLAAIYFRRVGDQAQALKALALHADSAVFDHTYNTIQSLCHQLRFGEAAEIARQALAGASAQWEEHQRGYTHDVNQVCTSLAAVAPYPTELLAGQVEHNRYTNLDGQEEIAAPGVVDHSPRRLRELQAQWDPLSCCWLERESGTVIGELLQPNHDFRSFFKGCSPWLATAGAAEPGGPVVEELAVVVPCNPHYGHFLTQSASHAASLPYACALAEHADQPIAVVSDAALPSWAQELLQLACPNPLRFVAMAAEQPLQLQRLVVTPPTWIEWHYVHHHHGRLFRQAAWTLLGANAEASGELKLYFSRSRLGDCLRRSLNEEPLEQALESQGFVVVHPQDCNLAEVIRLVNQAGVIAGSCGSAMHNVLFRLPGAPLTTLNFAHGLPATNAALVEAASGVSRNLYLRSTEEGPACDGGDGPNSLRFDLERCLEGVAIALN